MFFNHTRFINSQYTKYFSTSELEDFKYLTKIFPFKASRYILDELIEWKNKEDDPIYRLVFPQHDMLSEDNWKQIYQTQGSGKERDTIQQIRRDLNPNPDGQKDNIPKIGDKTYHGIQHKYPETILFFPAHGQTCHSFCTYCFRWSQFVNMPDQKFKSKDRDMLITYLNYNQQVTDVLFTGGDPMWMSNDQLFSYLDTIMQPELEHVRNIRIGTKSLAFFPERYLGQAGDDFLRKIESLIDAGKNISIMAHFSHPKELSTRKVRDAVNRLRRTGAVIRTQAPLISGINDDAGIWKKMWIESVSLGMIPYYMFVERDTGAHEYFSVPLVDAYQIFSEAYSEISGLAKTVRGPSMSAWPGKVLIDGIVGNGENKRFVLKFIQSRNPELINQPFYAKYDETATWFDDLEIEPAMGQELRELAECDDDSDTIEDVA